MFREYNIKLEIDKQEHNFTFFSYSGLSYFMGASASGMKAMEANGLIPQSCFIPVNPSRTLPKRLYLKQMVKEVVDLYEEYCPIPYKGRNAAKREMYNHLLLEYRKRVKALEDKWSKEKEEYLRNDLKSR